MAQSPGRIKCSEAIFSWKQQRMLLIGSFHSHGDYLQIWLFPHESSSTSVFSLLPGSFLGRQYTLQGPRLPVYFPQQPWQYCLSATCSLPQDSHPSCQASAFSQLLAHFLLLLVNLRSSFLFIKITQALQGFLRCAFSGTAKKEPGGKESEKEGRLFCSRWLVPNRHTEQTVKQRPSITRTGRRLSLNCLPNSR